MSPRKAPPKPSEKAVSQKFSSLSTQARLVQIELEKRWDEERKAEASERPHILSELEAREINERREFEVVREAGRILAREAKIRSEAMQSGRSPILSEMQAREMTARHMDEAIRESTEHKKAKAAAEEKAQADSTVSPEAETSTPPNPDAKSKATGRSLNSFEDMSDMTDRHQIEAIREVAAESRKAKKEAQAKGLIPPDSTASQRFLEAQARVDQVEVENYPSWYDPRWDEERKAKASEQSEVQAKPMQAGRSLNSFEEMSEMTERHMDEAIREVIEERKAEAAAKAKVSPEAETSTPPKTQPKSLDPGRSPISSEEQAREYTDLCLDEAFREVAEEKKAMERAKKDKPKT
jgi:hypothetical protein